MVKIMKFPKFRMGKKKEENINNIIILYDKAIDSLDDVLSFLEEIRKEYGRFFQFFVGEPLFFINKDLKKIINELEHKKWRIEKKIEKHRTIREIEMGIEKNGII